MKKLAKTLTEQAGRDDAKKNVAAKLTVEAISTDYGTREREARSIGATALAQRTDIHYEQAYLDAFRATLTQIWVTTLQAPEKARKGFREAVKRYETLASFHARAHKLAIAVGFKGTFESQGTLRFDDPTGKWWEYGRIYIKDESIWTERGREVDPDNPQRWLRARNIKIEVSFSGGSTTTLAEAVRNVNRYQEITRIAAELEVLALEARIAYFDGDFSDILSHSKDNRAVHPMMATLSEFNRAAAVEAATVAAGIAEADQDEANATTTA